MLHIASYLQWPKAKQDIFLYNYPFGYLLKSVPSLSSFTTHTVRGVAAGAAMLQEEQPSVSSLWLSGPFSSAPTH